MNIKPTIIKTRLKIMSEILLNAYSRRPPEYIASHEKLNNYPGKT
jgi:hypothetical protein